MKRMLFVPFLLFALLAVAFLLPTYRTVFAEEVTIQILGTSDVHGYYQAWDYASDAAYTRGSLAQIAALFKAEKEQNPNTILVDIGDLIQGNSSDLFVNDPLQPGIEVLNTIGYDIWEMGNHEYNFGVPNLLKFNEQFKGVSLAANVYDEAGTHVHTPYTIIEKGGIKIGFIGLVTPLINEFEAGTDHMKGILAVEAKEELNAVERELEGKVDAMVGLIHMGINNENARSQTGVRDLLKDSMLDAVICGHMHLLVPMEMIGNVPVTEPGKYAQAYSKVTLVFDKEGDKITLKSKSAETVDVTKDAVEDEAILKVLEPFHARAREYANEVIGKLVGANLVPANEIPGVPQVQIQETLLADFFHDVMLHYSGADVVAMQIDNDRAKLDEGDIKRKDIAFNYQYVMGEVSNFKMTGKDLKDYMEWSEAYFNQSMEGDVQISFEPGRRGSKYSTNDFFGNVTFTVDLTQPAGERVVDLKRLDGSPILPDDEVIVGMNEYRVKFLVSEKGPLAGRSFEKIWSSIDKDAYGEEGGTIRNLSIRYIGEVLNDVYQPEERTRWTYTTAPVDTAEQAAAVKLLIDGVIEVPKTEDGKYTNVASINVLAPLGDAMATMLQEKFPALKDQIMPEMRMGEAFVLVTK